MPNPTNEDQNAVEKLGYNKYANLHQKLVRIYGNAPCCVFCDGSKSSNFEWANATGTYNDMLENYLPLCVSCHRKFDYSEKQRELQRQRLKTNRIAMRGKVAQFKDGKLIKVHECLVDAARSVGRSHTTLLQHLNGGFKNCAGYQWKRVES